MKEMMVAGGTQGLEADLLETLVFRCCAPDLGSGECLMKGG